MKKYNRLAHIAMDFVRQMYLEVTPEKLKAEWNQILVTVTDLTSGRAVSRSAVFRLE